MQTLELKDVNKYFGELQQSMALPAAEKTLNCGSFHALKRPHQEGLAKS